MRYREFIEEIEDFGSREDVKIACSCNDVLDDIENKVNDALIKIIKIEGIDKIEECKEILKKLSNDLC